ncbi:hypothetical protein Ari01nite_45370 [Paractinoplanes rishiriensis]|uniref:Uncharacterized protein n=1 Tax=Paractinoplanes rishiriensis TaxID=1050105 RepID=A0A919N1J3_9ACTN|nr:hypothetical protein Ari01nite_45370 [Actinoplanes rishiriensis]
MIFGGAGLLAALAYLVNLRHAVDFDLDEVMYAVAAQNVARHGSISWSAEPTAVHPPLHFLLLGGWSILTGTAEAPVLDAVFAARVLGALVSVATVLMSGLLSRLYRRSDLVLGAVLGLVVVDGFLLRFGRTALIEPTAVLTGLVVVYLGLRLRWAPGSRYVPLVGAVSGIALLVKEPLLFTVLVPVLAAALEQDWQFLRRAAAAVLVGFGVWAVFPLWAVLGGAGGWWLAEHRTNLDRLAGFLQLSGMNRPGVSSTGILGSTFATYLSGYLIFVFGVAGLLRLLWTSGVLRRRAARSRPASLLAFAVLSFGFLGYCVLFGQANEQLTAYSAVPAVLIGVLGWHTPPRVVIAALLLTGVVAWCLNVPLARDDATLRMGTHLTNSAACEPVNATGDAWRWIPVLPRNRVESQPDGPAALASGTHLFLLSRKDSAMRYGVSSPELDTWVRGHGVRIREFPSRRYQTIELWSAPGPVPARTAPCGNPAAVVAPNASAGLFLGLLGGALALVAVGGIAAGGAPSRRSVLSQIRTGMGRPR